MIHNIEIMRTPWPAEPEGWERRFNDDLLARLERGDHAALVAYEKLGHDAQLAIPTPRPLPAVSFGARRATQ